MFDIILAYVSTVHPVCGRCLFGKETAGFQRDCLHRTKRRL